MNLNIAPPFVERMRALIRFSAHRFVPRSKVNKHTVQGMIYSLLQSTEFGDLHTKRGFKYFTFSDIFPPGDFYPGKEKNLLISSPNPRFIEALCACARGLGYIYLSDEPFEVVGVKKFRVPSTGRFITGSPVVLYKDSRKNLYLSFRRGDTVDFFLRRVRENAVKKYNSYYGDEMNLEEEVFDTLKFKKEVSVVLKKGEQSFTVIGSTWSLLAKERIPRGYGRFYRFLMDCGLGEKNSLGFGFLNPLR